MITVCEGWKTRHARIVLKPEDGGTPGVSHGMCPGCVADAEAELGAAEALQTEQQRKDAAYAEYLAQFPNHDPRD